MSNPITFLSEVRQEATKVTWPNRRETVLTTALVVAMTVAASAFLFATDRCIHAALAATLSTLR